MKSVEAVMMSEAGNDDDTVVVDLAHPVLIDLCAKSAPAASESRS